MEQLKSINKEIREITTLLREGNYWEEIGEYLVSEGYERREKLYSVLRYNDTFEVDYIKNNIEISIVNDLEVHIHYNINRYAYDNMIIERDKEEIFVRFE